MYHGHGRDSDNVLCSLIAGGQPPISYNLFSAFADALAWVLASAGVAWQLHYLDDFLLLGRPGSQEREQALRQAMATLDQLGVPIAAHKTEGPSTSLTFLGIRID